MERTSYFFTLLIFCFVVSFSACKTSSTAKSTPTQNATIEAKYPNGWVEQQVQARKDQCLKDYVKTLSDVADPKQLCDCMTEKLISMKTWEESTKMNLADFNAIAEKCRN